MHKHEKKFLKPNLTIFVPFRPDIAISAYADKVFWRARFFLGNEPFKGVLLVFSKFFLIKGQEFNGHLKKIFSHESTRKCFLLRLGQRKMISP